MTRICDVLVIGAYVLLSVGIFLFVLAIFAARRNSDRGHVLGLYAIGMYRIFAPLYRWMGPMRSRRCRACALIHYMLTVPLGCEIPLTVAIGPGFELAHTTGVIFHKDLVMGAGCKMTCGNNIGRTFKNGTTYVGNNVYFGAHSIVLGPVRVGNGVTIAAGAVVTKDIPDRAVVAGVPARVIDSDGDWEAALREARQSDADLPRAHPLKSKKDIHEQ